MKALLFGGRGDRFFTTGEREQGNGSEQRSTLFLSRSLFLVKLVFGSIDNAKGKLVRRAGSVALDMHAPRLFVPLPRHKTLSPVSNFAQDLLQSLMSSKS